jgi:cytochrome c peroxidase
MKLIFKISLFLFSVSLIVYSCSEKTIEIPKENLIGQLPSTVTHPADNPLTTEKVELGRMLFWDPVLSGTKDVACATCHHPSAGYAENLDLSIGVGGKGLSGARTQGKLIKRNAHSVLNTAYNGYVSGHVYDPLKAAMFWDNRAKSLEEQAVKPIHDMDEMRGPNILEKDIMDTLVNRLKNIPVYANAFEKVFGKNSINEKNIGKAIATFERTLVAKNSRFDRFAAGDKNALSDLEFRGMSNFVKAKCVNCHSGPMFSDFKLHVMGHAENKKLSKADSGANGKFAFRTPSLRNLSFTAPYMHNGSVKTIHDVIEFYEEVSGDGSNNPGVPTKGLDPIIVPIIAGNAKPMNLTHYQFDSIVAFLKTLDDENYDKSVPATVPSGLHPGGNIK